MGFFQLLLTLAAAIGLFVFILYRVGPDSFFGWVKVVFFYLLSALLVLLSLTRIFLLPVAAVIPPLAFLDNTALFAGDTFLQQGPFTYFLRCKDSGSCKALKGDVLLVFIMVDDPGSAWTNEDLAAFELTVPQKTVALEQEAARYGTDLRFKVKYARCAVDEKFARKKEGAWRKAALKAVGLPGTGGVTAALKEEYGVDEVAVLFCTNRVGRSYANQFQIHLPFASAFESAVIYRDAAQFPHELCHLFGTRDYYAPSGVKRLAERVFPGSIMLAGKNVHIDPLSAYVLGWSGDLPAPARYFIGKTGWVDIQKIFVRSEG